MNNSLVDFYCGGPEFGDMDAGKTVTTHATNTTFGEYYGAGFGGTSITYNREGNNASVNFGNNVTFPIAFGTTYKRLSNNAAYGIGSCYKFEFILYSCGSGIGVARSYTGYAKFDFATTGNVTNVLNGCTVQRNYYGAGCQGKVNVTVSSTLTGCTFMGSVFGGGNLAPSKGGNLTIECGDIVIDNVYGGANAAYVDGDVTLTLKGGNSIDYVFGGSKSVADEDHVGGYAINGNVTLTGNAEVMGNVYGGGNKAAVEGNTGVKLE